MTEEKHDIDYFIKFYEEIPEDEWTTGVYHTKDGKKHCALGHCDTYTDSPVSSRKAFDLNQITTGVHRPFVPFVNDGHDPRYKQETPKQRILAYLNDIKEKKI